VRTRQEDAQIVAALLRGDGRLAEALVQAPEFALAEHVEAALLPARDDEAVGEFVAELRRQDQPALLVELRGEGAEEHGASLRSPVSEWISFVPNDTTLLHFPPLHA